MGSVFVLYLVSTALLVSVQGAQPARKPNIVFVLADDYGYNDIGYHGDQIKTPVLNRVSTSRIINNGKFCLFYNSCVVVMVG